MLCLIPIVGGLLIMMGQHDRSEALFYYFRLDDQVPAPLINLMGCLAALSSLFTFFPAASLAFRCEAFFFVHRHRAGIVKDVCGVRFRAGLSRHFQHATLSELIWLPGSAHLVYERDVKTVRTIRYL